MTRTRIALCCVVSTFAVATANAQEVAGEAAETAAPTSFTGLDRQDAHTRAGFRMSYIGLDSDQVNGLGMELYGQYAAQLGNGAAAGGYGHLPMNVALVDSDAGDDEFAVGNLEVGGFYVMPIGETTSMVAHGGLSLATAADDAGGFASNLLGSMARLSQLPTSFPDTTWLTLGASPIVRQGNILFRADVNVYIPIDKPNGLDLDTFMNLNAGVGVDIGQATLLVELVNAANITGDFSGGDIGDRFINTVGFGVELTSGQVRPRAGIVLPLDSDTRDIFDFAFTAGVEGTM